MIRRGLARARYRGFPAGTLYGIRERRPHGLRVLHLTFRLTLLSSTYRMMGIVHHVVHEETYEKFVEGVLPGGLERSDACYAV